MVFAYLRERFHLSIYVPLAIAIALAATGGTTFIVDAGYALLLLAQFRIWDDLADRRRDALAHPQRVLVRATEVTPLIGLCLALAVLNLCVAVWRDGSGVAVAVLATLDAVLGTWYLARGGRTAAGDHLLLAKYPAMLVVVAGERLSAAPVQILGSAAALYVLVCAYEAWHDRGGPLARHLSIGGQ